MNELELEYFFFKLPIYTPIKITEENWNSFLVLLNLGQGRNDTAIEGYNPFRKAESTFGGWSNIRESVEHFTKYGGTDKIGIKCKRYNDILYFFIHYDAENNKLLKVGQFPSVADFHIYELKKYDKVLSKEKLKEFSRAIGLAANGVGIGSFVYLRRIFESLIWDAFEGNKGSVGMSDNDFAKMRIEDKIQVLDGYLPGFLVENKTLYSILSLGIHELTETDCLTYFDTVRVGIEIILDEKIEEIQKQEKLKKARQKISDLHGKLKK